jgi:hypothetical protein
MAARRAADAQARPTQPVKAGRSPSAYAVSGSYRLSGSQSRPEEGRCKFLPANEPVPVALSLRLDTPVEGGTAAAREQLNGDTLLIRAQDPNFACCWFSRPLDFGVASGNPAFWMLQKTARDTWLLCLRRITGEVAAYQLKTGKHGFPITLKRGRVSKEFTNWPPTVTVSWAQ